MIVVPPSMIRWAHGRGASARSGLLGTALAAAAGMGVVACTFIPPPPLPEELAAQQAEAAARKQAVRGGRAEPADGEGATRLAGNGEPEAGGGEGANGEGDGDGGAPSDNPWGYRRGDPADLGMTPEQMKAYALAQGDPEGGDFTLEEALVDLPGRGSLWVEMQTTQGMIRCRLFETQAPLTVANFVGLARGLRPALDEAQEAWTKRPFFDGVPFHRVIPGFVIQGGDPTGTGRGDTGYVIPDEFVEGLLHDEPGILSMANRGPGTGGAQFFVTLAPLPHLDGKHTVFGKCDDAGIAAAEKIAALRGPGDRPRTPQLIEHMVIVRR